MEFIVLVHRAEEGGFWAEVPSLEGCFAQGETVEEVLLEAQGAIESHLIALAGDGQPIPQAGGVMVATVRAA